MVIADSAVTPGPPEHLAAYAVWLALPNFSGTHRRPKGALKMATFKISDLGDPAPVAVELWKNDAGEPMGTVVFCPQDQSRVSTSQDLPAKQALELAATEAERRGGDVAIRDPDVIWMVGWGELGRRA
jgi:hypothetical protein